MLRYFVLLGGRVNPAVTLGLLVAIEEGVVRTGGGVHGVSMFGSHLWGGFSDGNHEA